ncbi:MAG: FeoB-associated Cys-rich membrane protein [Oscillospiraceae bacterium]|nr:FeoB-associated Cys-rich membrane protein [Oscillospiraceae bacterium]
MDMILVAVIILLVILAVYSMIKRIRSGRHIGCGGDCGSCPMSCAVHQDAKDSDP